ncbi:Hypothetical protein FNO222_1826 [Francisella orientalis]|uniref:Uncharacterized protein n=1 Tax=Francisella orientalis TaxID=299583 RepID=A0ABM5U816_9GAMM|nr:hypothetical protein FNO12_1811 [Francisella orientalis FNO12]AKN87838.1 Hypothetical protein FNO24_1813 [Francisella orientalis FNO24]AKN89377.1 Hypothetical protein FNO190_1811 [Francisella orientalis]AKU06136.1 Hypothetical protein FNO01_1811 [Francisella orientalis]QEN21053.1 Hypothetical protein FNO39_1826 [Francisella orientalis]
MEPYCQHFYKYYSPTILLIFFSSFAIILSRDYD